MNDFVSREEVIDIIHKTIIDYFDVADDDSEESISEKDKMLLSLNKDICNKIKEIRQSVGKWVSIDEAPHETYECDRCGKVINIDAFDDPYEEFKFCPECSIRMKK